MPGPDIMRLTRDEYERAPGASRPRPDGRVGRPGNGPAHHVVSSGIARVVLMAAVAIAVIDAFGVGPGSNIGRGLFVALTYTATIFDKMVIAGAGSITARGLIERVGMVEVLWSHWALAFLPMSVVTIFLVWQLALRLFPPEREEPAGGAAF